MAIKGLINSAVHRKPSAVRQKKYYVFKKRIFANISPRISFCSYAGLSKRVRK